MDSEAVAFPYEYGTDLHWFWGWGHRIESRLTERRPLTELEWTIFRPDESAHFAMLGFASEHPYLMKTVDDALGFVELRYEEFRVDPSAEANLFAAISDLGRLVIEAAAIIGSKKDGPLSGNRRRKAEGNPTEAQIQAVEHVLKERPRATQKTILAELKRRGGRGMSYNTLVATLDIIRERSSEISTPPTRVRQQRS